MLPAEGFGQDMRQLNRRLAANVLALLFVTSVTNAVGLCACLSDEMPGPHTRGMGHEGMADAHHHEGVASPHAGAVTSPGHEDTAIDQKRRDIATPRLVADCCAQDGQPGARGIVPERVNVQPGVKILAALSVVEPPDSMAAAAAAVPRTHRRLPTIPIYLQHLSLLI